MSSEPILLFLHGVGDGDPGDRWKLRIAETLSGLGYSGLDAAKVIAPKYAHALKGWDEEVPLPGTTAKRFPREAAKKNRRDFERRTGAIEFRLGRHERGNGFPGFDAAINLAVGHPKFIQADNYLTKRQIRAQVLTRILEKLPKRGKLVIVAHSLGSVIAADLVPRLPVGLDIAGMVTIGSPLANGSFNVDKLREELKDPPSNLGWWVNFWNDNDLVAAHRGVSSVFPWIVDFRLETKKFGLEAHSAEEYLSNETVGQAIGFSLFGSTSKEVAHVEIGADIPLDDTERLGLTALRYAYLVKMKLTGDVKDRYAGALRQVQARLVDDIKRWNTDQGRATSSQISRLAFDFSDPQAAVPEPRPSSHIPADQAVVLLTILAAENIIRPFEIVVPKDIRQAAMEDLTAEMGLGSQYGTEVFLAAKHAREVLSGARGMSWIKWGALGVGAAALVVATAGLALAAGAGLAGAALITSALASFGPGGMIGGLVTAGTLASAGGGGIAFGLASPATTAEIVEGVVARQLSAAMLRKRLEIDQDPATWRLLVETEIHVRREHERLDEFSDESSPGLKELKRKIDAVERALKCLRDNGLEPNVASSWDEEEQDSSRPVH